VTRCRLQETSGFGAKAQNCWVLFEKKKVDRTLFGVNPKNGVVEAVPRHKEIKEALARKILKSLGAE